jgi:hypothetical protein
MRKVLSASQDGDGASASSRLIEGADTRLPDAVRDVATPLTGRPVKIATDPYSVQHFSDFGLENSGSWPKRALNGRCLGTYGGNPDWAPIV